MKKLLLILGIILLLSGNLYSQQWSVSEPAGSRSVSDLDYYIGNNSTALDRLLADYNSIVLAYNSASQITASLGEVTVSNSDGSVRLFLRNTSATTITFSNIDTGTEAASTTYYVYAIAAAASSETATFKISTSATSPTGSTYYKKIGSFYNDASSNIDRTKVYANAYVGQPADSSGVSSITGIYNYGTSASTATFATGGMKIAYGTLTVAGSTNSGISNLPFTSTSTYSCTAAGNETTLSVQYNYGILKSSGSAATISNYHSDSRAINWVCLGY